MSKYPVFHFERDSIIKTGWSKQKNSEYQHKAPVCVLSDLATSIAKFREENALFNMDMILPIKNSDTNEDYPSYHSYIALAFLLDRKYVKKYGRDGYEVTTNHDSFESFIKTERGE